MKALEEFGCFVDVKNGILYDCPMLVDGTPELSDTAYGDVKVGDPELGIVTDPDSQDFLDAVNQLFGTNFQMADFDEREPPEQESGYENTDPLNTEMYLNLK